jgi:FkbM family methyltransferase
VQVKQWLKWLPRPIYEGVLQTGKRWKRGLFDISDPMSDLQRLAAIRPPQAILDIGAHHGQTALGLRNHFPQTLIHSFEPFPESFAKLQQATSQFNNFVAHPFALGAECETAQFYSNRNSQTNSLLPVDTAAISMGRATENVGTIDVQVRTLDSMIPEHFSGLRLFIKADVQGAELKLIEGAQKTLAQQTDVFFTEVSLSPLYQDQGDLFSIHRALTDSLPFELYQIYRTRSNSQGKALWADAMWIRKEFFPSNESI